MPWQLSGNGRSGWSTKLIRGLKAEAAAGFQSRRERCREPTPVTPQYAAFTTYKAARVHHNCWSCDHMATRGTRAAIWRAYAAHRRPDEHGREQGSASKCRHVRASAAAIGLDRGP